MSGSILLHLLPQSFLVQKADDSAARHSKRVTSKLADGVLADQDARCHARGPGEVLVDRLLVVVGSKHRSWCGASTIRAGWENL